MIKVIAKITLKPEHVEMFKTLVPELVSQTRKESGCIAYQLYNDTNQTNVFSFIEEWESDTHLKAHLASPHFTTIFPQITALQEKDMELSTLNLVL